MSCCNGGRSMNRVRKGFDVVVALTQLQAGINVADSDTVNDRWRTCNECDQFDRGVCRQCGCHMSIKARLTNQACPLEKW